MKLWSCSVVVLGVFVGLARAELGLMTTIMKGMHEACFVEELVEKTVIFIKHDASLLDVNTRQPISHIPFDLLLTVRDPQGHLVLRQQDKPNKGAFMTAALDGEYTICFQSMPSQFVANVGTRLSVEIFIGEDRDPRITAPIDVQLHDLSREIAESNKLIAHVELEQKLQRVRTSGSCGHIVTHHLRMYVFLGGGCYYRSVRRISARRARACCP